MSFNRWNATGSAQLAECRADDRTHRSAPQARTSWGATAGVGGMEGGATHRWVVCEADRPTDGSAGAETDPYVGHPAVCDGNGEDR